MAKNWREIRKEAVARGLIDETKIAEHRARTLAEVRAYRLAEVRKAQQLTQVEVAEAMDVSQSRVSQLEKGALETTELGTVRKYVEALGGELRIIADFGFAGSLPVDLVMPKGNRVAVEVKRVEHAVKQATVTKDGPVTGAKKQQPLEKQPVKKVRPAKRAKAAS